MVSVSIFSVIILIFVLHTILTHLLNWLFREMSPNHVMLPILLSIVEFIVIIASLNYFIN